MQRFAIGRFAGACLIALAAPAFAQTSVTVRHINLRPETPAEAHRTLAKLDDAALRACGASGFSLAEAKAAMRASPCWQEAVGGAVRQINSPALTQLFARTGSVGH